MFYTTVALYRRSKHISCSITLFPTCINISDHNQLTCKQVLCDYSCVQVSCLGLWRFVDTVGYVLYAVGYALYAVGYMLYAMCCML